MLLAHQVELVEKRRLRVEPPPPPPNWLSKCKEGSWNPVRQGAKLELFLEEGWWPVELIKKKVGGKDSHKVWSPMYDKYHTVPSKRLRPDPLG